VSKGLFHYYRGEGLLLIFAPLSPTDTLFSIAPSPVLLASHFFAVAFYSIWVMFTHPSPRHSLKHPITSCNDEKPIYTVARLDQYPQLLVKSIRVVRLLHQLPEVFPDVVCSSGRRVSFLAPLCGQRFDGGRPRIHRGGTRSWRRPRSRWCLR
jgi:hypothetical protein